MPTNTIESKPTIFRCPKCGGPLLLWKSTAYAGGYTLRCEKCSIYKAYGNLKPACWMCRYWCPVAVASGECRKRAPIVPDDASEEYVWPVVPQEAWCGDYKFNPHTILEQNQPKETEAQAETDEPPAEDGTSDEEADDGKEDSVGAGMGDE